MYNKLVVDQQPVFLVARNEKINILKPPEEPADPPSNSLDDYNDVDHSEEPEPVDHSGQAKPDHEKFLDYMANRVHTPPRIHYKRKSVQCEKCRNSQNVLVTEEELADLRIEFVKKQILEKLRLKEPPVVASSSIPQPIRESIRNSYEDDSSEKELDDYYARSSKKFIMLERGKNCEIHIQNSKIFC